jgi:pimeloyl-ACP methyl ester carboxylesterase
VLLVRGLGDTVVGEREATEIVALTDGAQLVSIPGVGHFPEAFDDDGVARGIDAFLSEAVEA